MICPHHQPPLRPQQRVEPGEQPLHGTGPHQLLAIELDGLGIRHWVGQGEPDKPARMIAAPSSFLPGDLEAQIAAFIDDYNHRRYHESIENITPADVYCGRGPTILAEQQRMKRPTIANRRL
jgi:transposase InsO family protein